MIQKQSLHVLLIQIIIRGTVITNEPFQRSQVGSFRIGIFCKMKKGLKMTIQLSTVVAFFDNFDLFIEKTSPSVSQVSKTTSGWKRRRNKNQIFFHSSRNFFLRYLGIILKRRHDFEANLTSTKGSQCYAVVAKVPDMACYDLISKKQFYPIQSNLFTIYKATYKIHPLFLISSWFASNCLAKHI